jgi:putative salt-induced outer membrane protein YdiY
VDIVRNIAVFPCSNDHNPRVSTMKKIAITRACLAASLFLLALSPAAHAAKADVVGLINGDDVTGEVKSLEFGELRYSTDSMGTVSIEWEEIVSLQSDQALQVEDTSGTRYFGNLVASSRDGLIAIGLGENVQELEILHVVRITPIETDEKIWQRMEGSVKFGFDSDKASSVTSGYLNADVRYRARTYLLGLESSYSFTDQPGAETTENQRFGLNYQRFRANRWYNDWFASTEKNDAQGIENRLTAGGGLGRYLIQSNNDQFSLLGGLVASRETFTGTDPATTNAEGKIGIKYLHRRNEPSSDITLTTDIYPLLEDFSNFRSNSNLSLRREIIDDLFFDLSFFYNYLSDPPQGAEKDDYGVITSLGYSF